MPLAALFAKDVPSLEKEPSVEVGVAALLNKPVADAIPRIEPSVLSNEPIEASPLALFPAFCNNVGKIDADRLALVPITPS